jgi:hypothetical protein
VVEAVHITQCVVIARLDRAIFFVPPEEDCPVKPGNDES